VTDMESAARLRIFDFHELRLGCVADEALGKVLYSDRAYRMFIRRRRSVVSDEASPSDMACR
jgi:hypothetical protein